MTGITNETIEKNREKILAFVTLAVDCALNPKQDVQKGKSYSNSSPIKFLTIFEFT